MLKRVLQHAADTGDALLTRLAPSSDAAAQVGALSERGHRPWPMPDGRWVQGQTWRDLLFAHWPVPVDPLRQAVPAALPLDTFGGRAWLGIVPFEIRGLRVRGMPPVHGLARFPETNVRTYTTVDGKRGIYFLSLDAANPVAVAVARLTYRLPYFLARMSVERAGDEIVYRSRRRAPEARLALRYGPSGAVFNARPGTLEHFLTERYCLYTLDKRGHVFRADIHHRPWPLQPADGEFDVNTMTAPYGVDLPDEQPLLHFAARQDVVIWPLRRLD